MHSNNYLHYLSIYQSISTHLVFFFMLPSTRLVLGQFSLIFFKEPKTIKEL